MKRVGLFVLAGALAFAGFTQQADSRIQFGRLSIVYERLVSTQLRKDKTVTVEVVGSARRPVSVDAPDQNFRLTTLRLQGVLAPSEQGQMRVQSASAIGRVEFFYDRKEPFTKLYATANRADYDEQQQTVTLTGDVSVDSEDEFYQVRWRENERVVVYLGQESLRVEAQGKPRDDGRRGEMVVIAKRTKPSP
ncbi:MAG: hypothetical protein C4336_02355 [Armatimonadota bacterium]